MLFGIIGTAMPPGEEFGVPLGGREADQPRALPDGPASIGSRPCRGGK